MVVSGSAGEGLNLVLSVYRLRQVICVVSYARHYDARDLRFQD
jgi:hypothetical protein